jgi:mannose-6-phosphate isomerase-like protein (cupin superfamily)
MPELIKQPSRVTAAGEPPKLIDEYVGRVNTGQDGLSIAHMRSPSGWAEPGQRPEFDEFTIVLRGALVVESEEGQLTVQAGQGVHTRPGEWVRYRTPGADGAEYIAVCLASTRPADEHPARPTAPRHLIRRSRLRSPARCPAPGGAAAAVTGTMRQRPGYHRDTFTSCRSQTARA